MASRSVTIIDVENHKILFHLVTCKVSISLGPASGDVKLIQNNGVWHYLFPNMTMRKQKIAYVHEASTEEQTEK